MPSAAAERRSPGLPMLVAGSTAAVVDAAAAVAIGSVVVSAGVVQDWTRGFAAGW